jgi:hypothetical protein
MSHPLLSKNVWKHPRNYFGYSPDGDFIIVGQHRDSDCLDRSNYTCAMAKLSEVAKKFQSPPEEPDEDLPRTQGWVYDFRQNHFMVGWSETLLVRKDAPAELLDAAEEILQALEAHPTLDKDHFSKLEQSELAYLEAEEHWDELTQEERVSLCKYNKADVDLANEPYPPQFMYE